MAAGVKRAGVVCMNYCADSCLTAYSQENCGYMCDRVPSLKELL